MLAAAAVAILATACASQKSGPELVQPVGETHTTSSSTGGGKPQGNDNPWEPIGVIIAEEVRRACNLPAERQRGPTFDLDSARLRPRGHDTLAHVAACVTSGKLDDEPLAVIGHTDARGDAPYNEQLGLYRALAGKQYLVEHGVSPGRLSAESHGSREARGTDEASWALDHTIDIRLARAPGDIPK